MTKRHWINQTDASALYEKGRWVIAVWVVESESWQKLASTDNPAEANVLFDSAIARHYERSAVMIQNRGGGIVCQQWNLGRRPRNVRPREPRANGSTRGAGSAYTRG
jgi:hypothetical protein